MELYAQAAQLFLAEDSTSEAKKCREKVSGSTQWGCAVVCNVAAVSSTEQHLGGQNCWRKGSNWDADWNTDLYELPQQLTWQFAAHFSRQRAGLVVRALRIADPTCIRHVCPVSIRLIWVNLQHLPVKTDQSCIQHVSCACCCTDRLLLGGDGQLRGGNRHLRGDRAAGSRQQPSQVQRPRLPPQRRHLPPRRCVRAFRQCRARV